MSTPVYPHRGVFAPAKKARQAGMSTPEMLIYLGVAAIIGLIAYYGLPALGVARGQGDGQLLTQAAQCARNNFAYSTDFSGVTTAVLAGDHCFPAGNVAGASPNQTVSDSNGYSVTAAPATLTSTNDSVAFTVHGVSEDVCTAALAALAPAASQLSAGPAGSGGATVLLPFGGTYAAANVPTACSSSSNDIIFTVTK